MKKGVAEIRVTEQYIKNVVHLALVDRVSISASDGYVVVDS